MKKNLLTVLLLCFTFVHLFAQATFNTMDSLDINNINASVLVHGDMWWNPTTQLPTCFFPNGTKKNISFASALWMSGYDASGGLHVAAQTYRQDGNDFWPGPLDAADTLTYATSAQWAKIWKINRSDINFFLMLPTHDSLSTPQDILRWPGAGNTFARGNTGLPLTYYPGSTYAPFTDLNGNGIYEPLLGEYPDFPGDQALWYLFSDNGPTHNNSNGKPLGIEVQALAYAYHRGTLIDNVIYYQYELDNHSENTYHDFRLALWADMDLGYYYDDFIGFDSSHRMGITYNGTNCDGCSAGDPLNAYGENMPMAGVTLVSLPGDAAPAYIPTGSFSYHNIIDLTSPLVDTMLNKCIQGANIYGPAAGSLCPEAHFSSDTSAPTFGPHVNYEYPGDPGDNTTSSECNCSDPVGDRCFVLASNDFTILPGSKNKVVMALVTTNLDSMHGCGVTSFHDIKIVADTAWANYYAHIPSPAGIGNVSVKNTINIYPNPAHDVLYIETTSSQNFAATITVFNTLGQVMNVTTEMNNNMETLNILLLPTGIYYLQYRNGTEQKNIKFIKE